MHCALKYLVMNESPKGVASTSLSLSLLSPALLFDICVAVAERGIRGDVSMLSIKGREILNMNYQQEVNQLSQPP